MTALVRRETARRRRTRELLNSARHVAKEDTPGAQEEAVVPADASSEGINVEPGLISEEQQHPADASAMVTTGEQHEIAGAEAPLQDETEKTESAVELRKMEDLADQLDEFTAQHGEPVSEPAPCAVARRAVLDCYLNAESPLACADLVQRFAACVQEEHASA